MLPVSETDLSAFITLGGQKVNKAKSVLQRNWSIGIKLTIFSYTVRNQVQWSTSYPIEKQCSETLIVKRVVVGEYDGFENTFVGYDEAYTPGSRGDFSFFLLFNLSSWCFFTFGGAYVYVIWSFTIVFCIFPLYYFGQFTYIFIYENYVLIKTSYFWCSSIISVWVQL